jgi:hypothetical protein
MRRTVTVFLTLVTALLLGSSVALAASPHFIGPVRATDVGTQLRVTGSIAGLGNENIDVQVVAEGVASITCTNPGGNVAPGQDTSITATGTATNVEVKNGRASFDVTTAAPTAEGAFVNGVLVCPNPQWTATITDVAFTSYTINVFQPSGSGNLVLSETRTL